jgi:hypothetical protein
MVLSRPNMRDLPPYIRARNIINLFRLKLLLIFTNPSWHVGSPFRKPVFQESNCSRDNRLLFTLPELGMAQPPPDAAELMIRLFLRSFIKRTATLAHPRGTGGLIRRSCAWPRCRCVACNCSPFQFNGFWIWKAMLLELGVGYNMCKQEPKIISHQFIGFLDGLHTHVLHRRCTLHYVLLCTVM